MNGAWFGLIYEIIHGEPSYGEVFLSLRSPHSHWQQAGRWQQGQEGKVVPRRVRGGKGRAPGVPENLPWLLLEILGANCS